MTAEITVEIVERAAVRLGAVRHIGPYGPEICEAFDRLNQIAGRAGLFQQPGMECVALYHDSPQTVPADQLRSDAAITVPEGMPMPDGLTEFVLPGGRFARYTHMGSYEGLSQAWGRFAMEWLPKSGNAYRFQLPMFESYLNNPSTTPPDQLRTDLYIPLA